MFCHVKKRVSFLCHSCVVIVSFLCGFDFVFLFFSKCWTKIEGKHMKPWDETYIYIYHIYHILNYVFIISWCKYTTCWDLPINPLGFTMIYPSIGHGITSPVNVFHRPTAPRVGLHNDVVAISGFYQLLYGYIKMVVTSTVEPHFSWSKITPGKLFMCFFRFQHRFHHFLATKKPRCGYGHMEKPVKSTYWIWNSTKYTIIL